MEREPVIRPSDDVSARISRRVRRIRLKDVAAAYNLERAVRKMASSRTAPGSDGLTIHQLNQSPEFYILSVQQLLLLQIYRPRKVRKIRVAKMGGGFRTLQIPSVLDRVVGRAILEAVAPKFHPYLPSVNFAFRRGSGALDAVRQATAVARRSEGWMVKTDIRAFFDRVRHSVLLEKLKALPFEQDLLELLQLFFTRRSKSADNTFGLPQGSVLSPFLANIYLATFDKQIVDEGITMVRYADDLLFIVPSKAEAERVLHKVKKLLRPLGLALSQRKTYVVPASRGAAFLGFEISSRGCTLSNEPRRFYQAEIDTLLSGGNRPARHKKRLVNYATGWLSFYAQAVTDQSVNDLVQWTVRRCGQRMSPEEVQRIIKCSSPGDGGDTEDNEWPEYPAN